MPLTTTFQSWIEFKDRNRVTYFTAFQWIHFFSEMDSTTMPAGTYNIASAFQWGHFFSEMDRLIILFIACLLLVFQWGHFFSEMDR